MLSRFWLASSSMRAGTTSLTDNDYLLIIIPQQSVIVKSPCQNLYPTLPGAVGQFLFAKSIQI